MHKIGIKNNGIRKFVYAIIAFLIFGMIWGFLSNFTKLSQFLPGPIATLSYFVEHCSEKIGPGTIPYHAFCSLKRIIPAFCISAVVGVACGLLMAMYMPVDAIIRPIFSIIRPIPPVAWIPLAILWFGIDDKSKYFLISLATFVSVLQNAYDGAKAADPQLLGVGKMLGANGRQLFTTVVLPGSVPYIFAGLQLGLNAAWGQVVGSEMIRATNGLGWLIIRGTDNNNIVQELAGIFTIGILGYALAATMRLIEDKLVRWNKRGT